MREDIRYGARRLWQSPTFSLVSISSLALGLGAGVAFFTFMNALLFRPLPGRDTAAIQRIYTSNSDGSRYGGSSFSDFQALTRTPGLFSAACATRNVTANLTTGGRTQALSGALVNGGCFDAIRLRSHLGRLLRPDDDTRSSDSAPIVISHAFWLRAFGGEAGAIGRGATLGGASAVIVGVAEPGFAGLNLDGGSAFWAPASLAPILMAPDTLTARRGRVFTVYARLADGVTQTQASERLTAIAAGLQSEDPDAWTDDRGATRAFTIVGERDARFAGGGAEPAEIALLVLAAIAGVVAMACVNLATMFLARGVARTRELSIRMALGASRARILRQLLIESLLVSALGGAAGLGLVAATLEVFHAYRPTDVPAFNLAIDWRVTTFAVLLALIAPIVFGLAPGAHALRLAIVEGLKGRPGLRRRRFLPIGSRELLPAVQITLSFALLVVASLLMRSLASPGPDARVVAVARQVMVVPIDLGNAARSDDERRILTDRMLTAAAQIPDVAGAAMAALVPMTGSYLTCDSRPDDRPQEAPAEVDCNIVAPGYFEIVGTAPLAGRGFDARDREGALPVTIVSESLARRLWNTTSVVGRAIRMDDVTREVVGVVADVPYRSFEGAPQPVAYVPLAQAPRHAMVLHARVRNPGKTAAALDRALRSVDARMLIDAAVPLSGFLDRANAAARATQWVSVAAGATQLGLALMAIWGLVAYAVERRTAEFALRRALGETETGIVRLAMRPSLLLLVVGGVAGCAAGVFAAQALHSEFLGLAPLDLTAVVPAAVLASAVVVAAAWWPARRAAAIEPAAALRP